MFNYDKEAREALRLAQVYAQATNAKVIETGHLLLALIVCSGEVREDLRKLGLPAETLPKDLPEPSVPSDTPFSDYSSPLAALLLLRPDEPTSGPVYPTELLERFNIRKPKSGTMKGPLVENLKKLIATIRSLPTRQEVEAQQPPPAQEPPKAAPPPVATWTPAPRPARPRPAAPRPVAARQRPVPAQPVPDPNAVMAASRAAHERANPPAQSG